MKKILVNATICDSKPTGLGVYTINILKKITKLKGYNISVLKNDQVEIELSNAQNINSPSSLLSSKGWKAQLLRILYLNIKLFSYGNKYDYIINTVPEGTIFNSKKNQITVIHDILPVIYKKEYPKSYYYYKYYVPLLLRKSKYIVVPSINTKKDIMSFYKSSEEKIFVANNGYDHDHFERSSELEINKVKNKYKIDKYFLYVGNLYPHKNLENAIISFSEFREKHKDIKFVITGDKNHWNYNNLVPLIKRLKLENEIIFLDYVEYDDLPKLYSGAIAFIYVSLYEGFGLPLIEAMACGCPVITSNNSSLKEISEQSAIHVEPLSINEIVKGMYNIYEDLEYRNELIDKGLENAAKYSWEKTVKVIEGLLK